MRGRAECTTSSVPGPTRATVPRRYRAPVHRETRSIVALLSSVFAASSAWALLDTVLGKLVFDMTGSELALGLIGLAEFAPAALLVFVTGTVADRVDRRRLAAVSMCLEALTLVAITAYAATDPTSTLPIFLLVIAFGTARAFATPATRSLPADSVSADAPPVAHRPPVGHVAGGAHLRSGPRRLPLRGRPVGAVRGRVGAGRDRGGHGARA